MRDETTKPPVSAGAEAANERGAKVKLGLMTVEQANADAAEQAVPTSARPRRAGRER